MKASRVLFVLGILLLGLVCCQLVVIDQWLDESLPMDDGGGLYSRLVRMILVLFAGSFFAIIAGHGAEWFAPAAAIVTQFALALGLLVASAIKRRSERRGEAPAPTAPSQP